MSRFAVSTLHGNTHDGEFIVPCFHTADSHFEAAKQRFDVLASQEKKRVTALLVQKYDSVADTHIGQPRIFFVKDAVQQTTVREVADPNE